MPIVSLEEAVAELLPILPDVQSHAYVAKQRCKKPADDLTRDESASIMLYTMGWEPEPETKRRIVEALRFASSGTKRSEAKQRF